MKREEAVRLVRLARRNSGYTNPPEITLIPRVGGEVKCYLQYLVLSDDWMITTTLMKEDTHQLVDVFHRYVPPFSVTVRNTSTGEGGTFRYNVRMPYNKAIEFITNEIEYEERYGKRC